MLPTDFIVKMEVADHETENTVFRLRSGPGYCLSGNLLGKEIEIGYWICGILAVLLDILWILGRISRPARFREEMARPELASVSGTFSMSLMVLSGYLVSFLRTYAEILWYTGIGLHLGLMVWFTRRFLRPLKTENVYASWFIIYVGIAAAGISSPRPGAEAGRAFLLFPGYTPVSAGAGSDPHSLSPSRGSIGTSKEASVLHFRRPGQSLPDRVSPGGKGPGSCAAAGPAGAVPVSVAGSLLPSANPHKTPLAFFLRSLYLPSDHQRHCSKKGHSLLELPGMALKVFSAFNFLQSLTAWSLTFLVFCRFLAGLPIRKPRNHFFRKPIYRLPIRIIPQNTTARTGIIHPKYGENTDQRILV